MIVVSRVIFEFGMKDEQFAFSLYGRWDDFCRQGFVDVADRLLSEWENPDTVLYMDRLTLDLGTLTEVEFYEKFGKRLEECLEEVLRGMLHGSGNPGVKHYAVSSEDCRQLMYYLLHGYTAWDYGKWSFDLKQFMLRSLREEAEKLRHFLLAEGYREGVRKRLVFHLEDGMLHTLVTLTVSGEAAFINRYTDFMIRNYSREKHGQMSRNEYRNALWILVLAYVWSESRGFVSRKGLVGYTLRGLAAHAGIGILVLIAYLVQKIEELLTGDPERHELLDILEEIRFEERLNRLVVASGNSSQMLESAPEGWLRKVFASEKKGGLPGKDAEHWMEDLRRRLADAVMRREILSSLQEEEIEWLVKILVPADSEFIVAYARTLETEKEKGMYEGKAGHEFRYVKWDFIFAVLLKKLPANLDRRQFVSDVLHRLSSHYGIEYIVLVGYFRKVTEELPGWLVGVLGELGEEAVYPIFDIAKKPERKMQVGEEKLLSEMLVRPLSCRRLLSRMSEPEITGLVKRFLPHDQDFILNYAGRLSTAKERGMFEGRAGSEFNQLKWEFIFQLALTDAFNRKYFALAVLRELAAHYALEVNALLGYFYRYLGEEGGEKLGSVWQTIHELWLEVEEKQIIPDTELHIGNELEERLAVLERYLLTGEISGGDKDMYAIFMDLKNRIPERLRKRIGNIPVGILACDAGKSNPDKKFYAALILWWLEGCSHAQEQQIALHGMLQAVLSGNGKAEVRELRLLLACCLEGRINEYQTMLNSKENIRLRFTETDFPALLVLLSDFRRKEVAVFIRARKKELSLLFFSSSVKSRKFISKLREKSRNDKEFADFLKEVFGMEPVEEENRFPVTERINEDIVRQCLSGGNKSSGKLELIRSWQVDFRSCRQVIGLLGDNQTYQRIWIERIGNIGLRRLANELLQLEKKMDSGWDKNKGWEVLVKYTLPEYGNLSVEELYLIFIRELAERLTVRQREQLVYVLAQEKTGFAFWKNSLRRLQYVPVQQALHTSERMAGTEKDQVLIEVRNAGLVLFSPWFLQLFKRLGLLDEEGQVFGSVEAQIKGIYVLQALVDGVEAKAYEEHELFLNRVLVGLPAEEALPVLFELTDEEKEIVGSLVENLRMTWPKMKNASPEGIRQSFLQREGVLEEQEKEWKLVVSPAGIDVLLDSLPWGFSMIRQNWMEKILKVEWR